MLAARSALLSSCALRTSVIWLALLLCMAMPITAEAEPTFPALTGRIVDEAGLLTPDARAALEAKLAALEAKSTDQLAVVTLRTLQGYPIEDYGYQLGRKWGIGQKDKNNGILLIVAPNERKVRIEVGLGLEPIMTDAMSKLIIENAILPEFRRGDFSAGISAGVRDINDVLLGDAEEVKQRARVNAETLDFWSVVLIMFWLGVAIFVFYAMVQSIRNAPQAVPGQRRRNTNAPIVIPGGWGGGGGGFGGGGGWSGGGGGFGGGGSSGSW